MNKPNSKNTSYKAGNFTNKKTGIHILICIFFINYSIGLFGQSTFQNSNDTLIINESENATPMFISIKLINSTSTNITYNIANSPFSTASQGQCSLSFSNSSITVSPNVPQFCVISLVNKNNNIIGDVFFMIDITNTSNNTTEHLILIIKEIESPSNESGILPLNIYVGSSFDFFDRNLKASSLAADINAMFLFDGITNGTHKAYKTKKNRSVGIWGLNGIFFNLFNYRDFGDDSLSGWIYPGSPRFVGNVLKPKIDTTRYVIDNYKVRRRSQNDLYGLSINPIFFNVNNKDFNSTNLFGILNLEALYKKNSVNYDFTPNGTDTFTYKADDINRVFGKNGGNFLSIIQTESYMFNLGLTLLASFKKGKINGQFIGTYGSSWRSKQGYQNSYPISSFQTYYWVGKARFYETWSGYNLSLGAEVRQSPFFEKPLFSFNISSRIPIELFK
jgi:hypothetical protein